MANWQEKDEEEEPELFVGDCVRSLIATRCASCLVVSDSLGFTLVYQPFRFLSLASQMLSPLP